MLYCVEYNNSIPFFEGQSCQVNKVLITKNYSNLHVMLYCVEYNNSIKFFEEQSCQVNKVLIDC